jgi:hypothetical protein
MTPTNKLRFVERQHGYEQYDVKVTQRHGTEVCYRPNMVRILQQWWEGFVVIDGVIHDRKGEWRDVPLETE